MGDTDEKNSTYKELYIQKCEDGEAAFEKIMDLLENNTAGEKLIRIRWIIIGIWVWLIMRRTGVTGLWWY